MSQTAVPEVPANPGTRQSSPPPNNNPEFKYRNIQYILRASPLAVRFFAPHLDEVAHKRMAGQLLEALFHNKLDLLSLFTDDEQIKQIFKRKIQHSAACALRLYGLVLVLEIGNLDDKMRTTMMRVLKTVESEFSDLINLEEIADLKEQIASS